MADPTIGTGGLDLLRGIAQSAQTGQTSGAKPVTEKDFRSFLLDSLEKVNQLQTEADAGVQKLLTGETDNVAEVFTASKKAGVAFDLLMEIRNKLLDAYNEVQQMRV
jgi:flagellar hook-basal body complex protein FliE